MFLLTGEGTYSEMTWHNAAVESSTETGAYVVTAEFQPIGIWASCIIFVEDTGGNDPGTIQTLYGPVLHATRSSMSN